jgi:hypothetical protein
MQQVLGSDLGSWQLFLVHLSSTEKHVQLLGSLIILRPGILSRSRLRGVMHYRTRVRVWVWLGFLRGGPTSFLTGSLLAWDAGNCAVHRLPSWRMVAATRSHLRHDDGIAAGKICHGDWILTRIRWVSLRPSYSETCPTNLHLSLLISSKANLRGQKPKPAWASCHKRIKVYGISHSLEPS